MPYYLAPYVGTGGPLDPFRPRGSDQPGWSAIDLRPDGGATLGGGGLNACFLHLPVADPDPQLRLLALDPADTIGPGLRQAIVTRLNLLADPLSTRWDDLAMELLLGPPPGGWKPLRVTVNRQYDLWLGGLLKRLPVVSGGVSISENWNCADSASLTCQLTWTGAGWKLAGNQAQLVTSGGSAVVSARAESDLAGSDHSCQVTVTNLDPADAFAYAGAACRFASGASTFYTGLLESNNGGSDVGETRKQITGADTVIGATVGITWSSTDTVKIEANGSTITRYYNGVSQDVVTDTAIAGNTRCGIAGYGNQATPLQTVDNWSAADLGPTAAQIMAAISDYAATGGMVGRVWV